MADKKIKIKLEKPFPEEDFGFEKMFSNINLNLKGLQNWDMSNGTNFRNMFSFCKSLQDLKGLQNWNVSNGTQFQYMFANCKSLIDISALQNWNVSNDEDFSDMFKNCSKVKEIE